MQVNNNIPTLSGSVNLISIPSSLRGLTGQFLDDISKNTYLNKVAKGMRDTETVKLIYSGSNELINKLLLKRECDIDKLPADLKVALVSVTELNLRSFDSLNSLDDTKLKKIITSCPRIRKLNLCGCRKLTQNGFHALQNLVNLSNLNVEDTKIQNDSIPILAKLPLEQLFLRFSTLQENALAPFVGHEYLQKLQVPLRRLTDKDLVHLASIPHLEAVSAEQCELLTAKDFEALSKSTSIQEIDLASTRVNDKAVAALATMAQLKTINLLACLHITENVLKSFKYHQNLQCVMVGNSSQITDETIVDASHIPNLQRMILGECPQVTAAGYLYLACLGKLVFRFQRERIFDKVYNNAKNLYEDRNYIMGRYLAEAHYDVDQLPELLRQDVVCKSITSLDLSNADHSLVTDVLLTKMATRFPNLQQKV